MSSENLIGRLRIGRVPGYPRYRVLSSGSVWSRKGGLWRRLKSFPDKDGYLRVHLRESGKDRQFFVHQIVLLTFIGPCPAGQLCRHLDGDSRNNRLENLCWGTQRENCEDAVKHGTAMIGSRQSQAKLTEEKVREIRRRALEGGYGIQRVLAREYGVSDCIISEVVNGNGWKHVG